MIKRCTHNVGPDDCNCLSTGELVDLFIQYWKGDIRWLNQHDGGPYEANFLKLDCSRLKSVFGWKSRWNIDKTMEKIIQWTEVWLSEGDVKGVMDEQIHDFFDF